jgi:hypothetical protein
MVNITEVHRRAQQTGEEIAPSGADHCDHKFFSNRKDVYIYIYIYIYIQNDGRYWVKHT